MHIIIAALRHKYVANCEIYSNYLSNDRTAHIDLLRHGRFVLNEEPNSNVYGTFETKYYIQDDVWQKKNAKYQYFFLIFSYNNLDIYTTANLLVILNQLNRKKY